MFLIVLFVCFVLGFFFLMGGGGGGGGGPYRDLAGNKMWSL